MKVELVCKPHYNNNGLERYTAALIKHCRVKEFDVIISQPKTPILFKPFILLGRILGFDLTAFFQTFPFAIQRNEKGQLVHLTSQEIATWLGLFRLDRQPFVITVHDIFPHLLRNEGLMAELHSIVDRFCYKMIIKGLEKADMLIVNSHYTKTTLIEALNISKDKIVVIPLAVDHTTFYPRVVSDSFYKQKKIDPDAPIVLYVGSDAPRKNLDKLLEAFQIVLKTFPNALLLKVGSFTNSTRLKRLNEKIKSLNLKDHVKIFQNVSEHELVSFYNAATLFIFPSLFEGFGFPPLEAMACGTPVACSDIESLVELTKDSSVKFDPRDKNEIASATIKVLRDSTLRKTLSQKGLVRAQAFQWSQMADNTIRIYENLLK